MLVVVYWSELSRRFVIVFTIFGCKTTCWWLTLHTAHQFQVDSPCLCWAFRSLFPCLAQNHNRFLTVKALCAIVGAFSYYYCEILMLALVMPAAGSAPFDWKLVNDAGTASHPLSNFHNKLIRTEGWIKLIWSVLCSTLQHPNTPTPAWRSLLAPCLHLRLVSCPRPPPCRGVSPVCCLSPELINDRCWECNYIVFVACNYYFTNPRTHP